MPILEGTENEILRNFILFYKKEELEENSIFCFILACVAWRFWLGELSNKGGRGQRNREEIGAGATFFYFSRGFAARSLALRARIFRGYAAPAPGSTKPPCYAG